MSIEEARQTGNKAMAFLADNHLEPTPLNYKFAYHYIQGDSDIITREIDYHVENGIRLSQQIINEIIIKDAASLNDKEWQLEAQSDAIEGFISNVVRLSDKTKNQTHSMGTDIAREAGLIAAGAQGEELMNAVTRIIENAKTAERNLTSAGNQIERLQRDLAEAKNNANLDELTGIPNRRTARTHLGELTEKNSSFSIGIIDIDHFKRVNDNWGHAVGDRAIKLVASALQEALTPAIVARWGGEEFLVIAEMPADKLAEQIRFAKTDLAKRRVKVRETNEPLGAITFSSGVVCAKDREVDEAIDIADELLYQAKRTGRNRVICEGDLVEDMAQAA